MEILLEAQRTVDMVVRGSDLGPLRRFSPAERPRALFLIQARNDTRFSSAGAGRSRLRLQSLAHTRGKCLERRVLTEAAHTAMGVAQPTRSATLGNFHIQFTSTHADAA